MKLKKFYIITNKVKDPDHKITNNIVKYLEEQGVQCSYQNPEENIEHTKYRYTNVDRIDEDTDCIIVLGGDGTLIQAARDVHCRDIPMLGVNIGTLGYLTDTEVDTVYDTLDLLLKDQYEIDSRMMLKGSVYRNGNKIYENTALNDIVINRCGNLRVIDFDVYVNNEYLNSYSADGVIISTPTGSTAYSLSAGGPIIQPNAQLMMITPICPHTMNKRSIIFGANDEIEIIMSDNKRLQEERVATFDGEMFTQVITGDKIIIESSDKVSKFIKTNKIGFLQKIREKMI